AMGAGPAVAQPLLSTASSNTVSGEAYPGAPFVRQFKVKKTGSVQYVRPRVGYAGAGAELGSLGMTPAVQTVPAGSGDHLLTFVGVLPATAGITRANASAYFYSSAALENPTPGQVNDTKEWLFDVGPL